METKSLPPPQKQSILLSILFLIGYVIIIALIKLFLPSAQELLGIVENLYRQFGYWIVLLAGIGESVFLLGFYLPGSAAILLGAALAKSGVVFLPLIILLGTVGLTTGYTINYFLGKYGWYHLLARFGFEKGIQMAEKKLKAHQKKTLFLGYISPNTGAFISTAAGISQLPFKTFFVITFCSQLFWATIWGITAYSLGNVFIEFFLKYAIVIIYGVIAIVFLRRAIKAGIARWL